MDLEEYITCVERLLGYQEAQPHLRPHIEALYQKHETPIRAAMKMTEVIRATARR